MSRLYSCKNDYHCENIKLQDSKKACIYSNNKCIETFKTCEYYEGNEKDICESIIPRNYRSYTHKCVYEDNKCTTKNILCFELKDIVEYKLERICEDLEVTDPNKHCIVYIDKCIKS